MFLTKFPDVCTELIPNITTRIILLLNAKLHTFSKKPFVFSFQLFIINTVKMSHCFHCRQSHYVGRIYMSLVWSTLYITYGLIRSTNQILFCCHFYECLVRQFKHANYSMAAPTSKIVEWTSRFSDKLTASSWGTYSWKACKSAIKSISHGDR